MVEPCLLSSKKNSAARVHRLWMVLQLSPIHFNVAELHYRHNPCSAMVLLLEADGNLYRNSTHLQTQNSLIQWIESAFGKPNVESASKSDMSGIDYGAEIPFK